MDESEQFWRREAERFAPSELRTETWEELRVMLIERASGDAEAALEWVEMTERYFQSEFEASEAEAEEIDDPNVRLGELFLCEGLESWLEAFSLFRQGAPQADVLEAAEQGQRMLLLVQRMAEES